MHEAKDWSLKLNCPACGRLANVGSGLMASVMRCPYCRTKVIVERSGLRKVRKPLRKRPQRTSRETVGRASPATIGKTWHRLALMVCIFAIVTSILSVSLFTLPSYTTGFDESHALEAAAKSFQSAWISGDYETARRFVHREDVARFQRWSAPRSAALQTGFGSNFTGRVTEIQVVQSDGNKAEVRVLFEVRGHRQQQFQQWAIVEGQWRLRLP